MKVRRGQEGTVREKEVDRVLCWGRRGGEGSWGGREGMVLGQVQQRDLVRKTLSVPCGLGTGHLIHF